jgi:fructose-1,6-bisphosphatase
MEERNKTLGEFIIEKQEEFKYSSGELSRIINSIRLAAKVVNYKVNKAGLVDIVGAAGEQNIQGEDQQKLDVYYKVASNLERIFGEEAGQLYQINQTSKLIEYINIIKADSKYFTVEESRETVSK